MRANCADFFRFVGQALINAISQRSADIDHAFELANNAEIKIPDEVKDVIAAALKTEVDHDIRQRRRCLNCYQGFHVSLCFDLCNYHYLCNHCAREYTSSMLSNAQDQFPLVCYQCKHEQREVMPIVSAAKFRSNRLLLCLTDDDLAKLDNFELNAAIQERVFAGTRNVPNLLSVSIKVR